MQSPPRHVKRSGRLAVIIAQESAEPFVTLDGSTTQSKTTAVSVVSYFLPIWDKASGGLAELPFAQQVSQPRTSVVPPAGHGTIRRTDLAGYACPNAAGVTAKRTIIRIKTR